MRNTGIFVQWSTDGERLAQVVKACKTMSPYSTRGFEIYAYLSDERQVLLPEQMYAQNYGWLAIGKIEQPSIEALLKDGKVFAPTPMPYLKISSRTWNAITKAQQSRKPKAAL